MKFFSRKALVAGATAIAVSFAGVNVASAAEPTTTPALSSGSSASQFLQTLGSPSNSKPKTETGNTDPKDEDETDESLSSKPEDIKAWIGIITAVVGALSAIYSFVNKISK
nr:hypothetical protein [Corynebacterium sp. UBA5992]